MIFTVTRKATSMIQNIGNADRYARFGLGALLLLLAIVGSIAGTFGWIAGIVGAVLIATAFMNFCPIYKVLGLKTCVDC